MKFPVYFEVEWYCEGDRDNIKEGGFIYAEDYNEAMKIITNYYANDVVSVKLEMLDDCGLIFPIEKAQQIKELVDNGV